MPKLTERLLQAAGLGIWAVVALPDGMPSRSPWGGPVPWIVAAAAWLAAFAALARSATPARSLPLLLGTQSAASLALVAMGGTRAAALLVPVAAQAGFLLPPRRALAFAAAQTVLLAGVLGALSPLRPTLSASLAMAAFQAFALGASHLARSEREARLELARVNAELLATRELVAEGTRLGERLRISRDLHDTLGHHLTALSLSLEVASHVTEGKAAEHVGQARALARLLLAEVRDVVGRMREEGGIDLRRALTALASGVPEPAVHLALPDDLHVREPEQAHAVLRCVQEVVTNAVRHAEARNLWIEVVQGPDGLEVKARDDGRGSARFAPGLGLTGMRERIEEAGGRLEIATEPGRGFSLHAVLAPGPLGPLAPSSPTSRRPLGAGSRSPA